MKTNSDHEGLSYDNVLLKQSPKYVVKLYVIRCTQATVFSILHSHCEHVSRDVNITKFLVVGVCFHLSSRSFPSRRDSVIYTRFQQVVV